MVFLKDHYESFTIKHIFAGGVLKWEQQCKIIHMCTRKYMTVKDGQVTLTSDHLDPATVFRLHPVIRVNNKTAFKTRY